MSSGTAATTTALLRFDDGAVQFRQRLAVSILSCRPLLLQNIRSSDLSKPGLRNYEVSYLRLLDALTNGSRFEINNTGTQLRFHPGVLMGGEIEHHCPVAEGDDSDDDDPYAVRSIGWFLEGILPLAPFGKEPLSLTLTGITDGIVVVDPSPDYLRASVLPLMQHFGIGDNSSSDEQRDFLAPQQPRLVIVTRGSAGRKGGGGGRVTFDCPIVQKQLSSIDLVDPGKIKRVRGTAISCHTSSSSPARVAFAAKGLLQRLLPDVWIHTDVNNNNNKKKQQQQQPNSPALSLVLTGESTTGVVLTAECCLDNRRQQQKVLAEDLGQRGAALLLEEIRKGGCIDTGMQSLACLWMCLSPEDVSRIRVGTISHYTVESLRLFQQVFGVEFKVKADPESKTVLLSCLGTGYRNMARAST